MAIVITKPSAILSRIQFTRTARAIYIILSSLFSSIRGVYRGELSSFLSYRYSKAVDVISCAYHIARPYTKWLVSCPTLTMTPQLSYQLSYPLPL